MEAREWGRLIQKAREEAGLSRQALAERLDMAYVTIVRWEQGRNSPPAYRRAQIEQILARVKRQETAEPLDEMLEFVRALWTWTEGQGPYWEHLGRQARWIRTAMLMGQTVERRRANGEAPLRAIAE